ncbi:MAG: low specificity L-threonine aldolase [Rhodobacteraceae bacterium]|nr:low specificity L-threonine aldolase [Paracoccaceae bacterium]
MQFASDNTGPVHPRVLDALVRANEGYAPGYGADELTRAATARLRAVFEAPEAAVCLVATGTAANALSLATLADPWSAVFCSRSAHVQEDECGAPEFFTGGAKLVPVDGEGGRMDAGALRAAILAEERRGVHGVQRGPVTISEATEWGTIYGPDQVAAIAAVARDFGLPLHMDGARFANALVRAGCSPAELTWKAGVDVLSFGGTKNGLMGVEAVILFDPQRAREFELRRKRGGHLFSKHRFLAAQMAAYLHDDLWLDLARRANRAADRLAEGLVATGQAELVHPAEANMIFAHWPRRVHRTLFAAGAQYYLWEGTLDGGPEEAPLTARLVCDWSSPPDAADRFLAQFGS